ADGLDDAGLGLVLAGLREEDAGGGLGLGLVALDEDFVVEGADAGFAGLGHRSGLRGSGFTTEAQRRREERVVGASDSVALGWRVISGSGDSGSLSLGHERVLRLRSASGRGSGGGDSGGGLRGGSRRSGDPGGGR